MSRKKIHLIRTHITVGTGGPIPPLELLYVVSHINKISKDAYELKVTDTGIGELTEDEIHNDIQNFGPDIVILYALSWEAGLVHSIAQFVKDQNQDIKVIVFGQLATFSNKYLCEDPHIDFIIVGEPELTVVDLLRAFENNNNDYSTIPGLTYKREGQMIVTEPRIYPENLDEFSITAFAWGLIDVKEYARYANWNGATKEDFYIPILTSRGCPFKCTFCRETYGKKFLARSPEHVVEEIKFLHEHYGAKEIHIYDAVFNYDNERAKKICQLIIDSGLHISLAFPHGVRADIMTDELLTLMRKAGTYKLVYGIESASVRLQKAFRKNLNIQQVNEMISLTSKKGIIVGGYFMLGHATETEDEIKQTIDFAVKSDLDVASFFKATDYDDVNKIYQSKFAANQHNKDTFKEIQDIGYYSVNRSQAEVSARELNKLILHAQRRFYFNIKRIVRGFGKYSSKWKYFNNLLTATGLILQAYIIQSLVGGAKGSKEIQEPLPNMNS